MSSSLQDEDDFYLFAAHMCHKRRHQTLHQSGTNWMLIDSQDLNDRLVGYSDHILVKGLAFRPPFEYWFRNLDAWYHGTENLSAEPFE